MSQLLFEATGHVGTVPARKINPDTLARIKQTDPDPRFVTLVIGQVDAQSRNGRTYPLPAIEAMVQQINSGGITGIMGHLRADELAHRFDAPTLYWLAASIETNGSLVGTAYIVPGAARDHVELSASLGWRIGTSIYGTAKIDETGNVSDLSLETIDLAHPDRVGVPQTANTPVVTKETADMPTDKYHKTAAKIMQSALDAGVSSDDLTKLLESIYGPVVTPSYEESGPVARALLFDRDGNPRDLSKEIYIPHDAYGADVYERRQQARESFYIPDSTRIAAVERHRDATAESARGYVALDDSDDAPTIWIPE